MTVGGIVEVGEIPCMDCGKPHDAVCLEVKDGKPVRHTWRKNGHEYRPNISKGTCLKLWRVAQAAGNLVRRIEAEKIVITRELFEEFSVLEGTLARLRER